LRGQRGPWQFLTLAETVALEAIVDRLNPPDPETPGGKQCCAAQAA
jgi:gluconate 2-dehydrogenase gamma chain